MGAPGFVSTESRRRNSHRPPSGCVTSQPSRWADFVCSRLTAWSSTTFRTSRDVPARNARSPSYPPSTPRSTHAMRSPSSRFRRSCTDAWARTRARRFRVGSTACGRCPAGTSAFSSAPHVADRTTRVCRWPRRMRSGALLPTWSLVASPSLSDTSRKGMSTIGCSPSRTTAVASSSPSPCTTPTPRNPCCPTTHCRCKQPVARPFPSCSRSRPVARCARSSS